MSNEQYLVVSYFVVGAACAALAYATYAVLRRSLAAFTGAVPEGGLGSLFRRLFLPVLLLSALAGFFSVAYTSCDRDTYLKIIADRSYLVAKNRQQLGSTFSHLAGALLVWGLILAIAFAIMARSERKKGDD